MVGRVPGVASPHRRVEIRYVPYSHCPAVMSALPPHPMFFSERAIGLFGETNGRLYLATIHEMHLRVLAHTFRGCARTGVYILWYCVGVGDASSTVEI